MTHERDFLAPAIAAQNLLEEGRLDRSPFLPARRPRYWGRERSGPQRHATHAPRYQEPREPIPQDV
jgi:hypothetical protein